MLQDFRLRVMARTGHYYGVAKGAETACHRQVARLRGSSLSCDQYLGRLFGLYDGDRCWTTFDSLAPPWALAFSAKMISVLESKFDVEPHPVETMEMHVTDVMEIMDGPWFWAAGVEAGLIAPWEVVVVGGTPRFVIPRQAREWREVQQWAEKNQIVIREFARHPKIFRLRAKIMNYICLKATSRSHKSICISGAHNSISFAT